MTRRALSPAARGVLLAVSAALRGRVAEIHDGADGTTTATVTEPDGTVLLRCVVRAVGRRDSRQVLLPLAPGRQHATPAPVAVLPPPVVEPVRIRGLAVGDIITLDDDQAEVMGVDADGFAWRTVDDGRSYDEGDCEWSEVDELAPGVFRVRAVEIETPAQQRAAKPARAPKLRPARLTPVPEADALAMHSETVIAWQSEEGGAWDRAWTEKNHGGLRKGGAWAEAVKGHRAREYNRGGKCVRDSRDEGGAP